MDSIIRNKIRRLNRGEEPRFLDLFAGCGGLSLGLTTAGFSSLGAVEIDAHAAKSHGINFFNDDPRHSKPRCVNEDPDALLSELCSFRGRERIETKVDVLVGGPPCQAFARVGRAKLRSEARRTSDPNAEHAYMVDARGSLYERYLLYVETLKPIALLMENVPDILNHGGENVAEIVADHLEQLGYDVEYRLLNASNFGVPQIRERMILLAIHRSSDFRILWPKPTHNCKLPSGYLGTRATALKYIGSPSQSSFIANETHYAFVDDLDRMESHDATVHLSATSAREALQDLPALKTLDRAGNPTTEKGRRDLDVKIKVKALGTGYAKLMREWPGF